jgi:hypothetical protein
MEVTQVQSVGHIRGAGAAGTQAGEPALATMHRSLFQVEGPRCRLPRRGVEQQEAIWWGYVHW